MRDNFGSLRRELQEKYAAVLQLHAACEPVFPIIKEMWILSEKLEFAAHERLVRTQDLSNLLRDFINACESAPVARTTQSFGAIIEHALQHPHEKYFLAPDDTARLKLEELKAAIDALTQSKATN